MKNSARFSITAHGDREIVVVRVFAAPRRLVFDAYTQPELVRKWLLGPNGWSMPVCEIDLRVGGRYRIANLLPSGATVWIHGEFEVVDPPRLVVYTWGLGLDAVASERVTVSFTAASGGTELQIHHQNIPLRRL